VALQRGDVRPGPLKRIDEEHAVTMAIDDVIAYIILQVAHPLAGTATLMRSSAASDPNEAAPPPEMASHCEPIRVYFGPALEVIQCAHSIPTLDSRRVYRAPATTNDCNGRSRDECPLSRPVGAYR